MKILKNFSWSFFVLIMLCSIMPFSSVSCGDQKLMTMTGVQLVKGGEINLASENQKMDPNPVIAAVFSCAALAAIVLLISKTKPALVIGLLLSIAGAMLLITYKLQMDDYVLKEGGGAMAVGYEAGYWAALVLFVAGAFATGVAASGKEE